MDISNDVSNTNKNDVFISHEEAGRLERVFKPEAGTGSVELTRESTLETIIRLYENDESFGVLNFASAKNPGGGFLNGALAQEESLAAASGLYLSQRNHPAYYEINRACKSMVYTDNAIWSPDVVFFRNDRGDLLPQPAKASVLTLPAVNYGQVLLKKENADTARAAMKRRMKIALAIFANQGCGVIVLGAYGCGVFRNNPADVALWWRELLSEFGGHFSRVVFSVLDRSKSGDTFSAFADVIDTTRCMERTMK